ncbi:MAG: GNAT family N-acetyltransferase [Solirubrobacterales bacterium]|nr:GNAT family N-acetyltransferase [Solirubrobacterales bacterium]
MSTAATLERVETPRLVCERLRMEHMPEISPLLRDPRVAEWLWPHGEPTEQDVLDGTRQKEDHWERYGFGLWLLRDNQTRKAVGWGGLQWTYVSELDEVEAAWAIAPERWRQGLATELAQAAISSAFGPLGLREIIAFTLPDNVASRRVMEKTGFDYEREIVHALLVHVLYRRRAE